MYFLRNCGNGLPIPVSASATKFSKPHPFFLVQNRTKSNDPSGRIFPDTRKSSRSMIFVPSPIGVIPESTLNPSTAGRESTDIPIRFIISDFFLFHPNISILIDMIFSNTAMTVDSAANDMNMKNSIPHTLPPGM